MADKTDDTARAWTVLDQEQTIGLLSDRTYGPVMRIKFRTAGNVVRSVDVPVADYSRDAVVARLDEAAAETDAIQNL